MTPPEVRDELEAALGHLPHRIALPGALEGGSVSPVDTALKDWYPQNDPETTLVPTLCNGFTNPHYPREGWGTVAYGTWPVRHTPKEALHGGVHAVDERVHRADLGYATRFHIDVCQAFDRLSRRESATFADRL